MQATAARCNVSQHRTARCNASQHSTVQYTPPQYNTMQCKPLPLHHGVMQVSHLPSGYPSMVSASSITRSYDVFVSLIHLARPVRYIIFINYKLLFGQPVGHFILYFIIWSGLRSTRGGRDTGSLYLTHVPNAQMCDTKSTAALNAQVTQKVKVHRQRILPITTDAIVARDTRSIYLTHTAD